MEEKVKETEEKTIESTAPEGNAGEEQPQLSKTESYIESNKNSLTIIATAIILAIGIFVYYQKFYLANMNEEAKASMFMAEKYFEQDSLELALNGNFTGTIQSLGFLDIIDEYGATESANLAHYYAGIIYLHQGNYSEAIEYLNGFDASDEVLGPIAIGATGDAHMELGELEEAADNYRNAADRSDNNFVSPIYLMKAGMAYEELGHFESAAEVYEIISKNYPKSNEGREIEKYLTRAKKLAGNL